MYLSAHQKMKLKVYIDKIEKMPNGEDHIRITHQYIKNGFLDMNHYLGLIDLLEDFISSRE